jgi:hypothetical protein
MIKGQAIGSALLCNQLIIYISIKIIIMKKIIICIIAAALLIACNNAKKEKGVAVQFANTNDAKEKVEYQSAEVANGLVSSGNTSNEQKDIVNYADTATANTTNAIEQTNQQLETNNPTPATKVAAPKKLPSTTYEDWDKKIIKTGNIVLELNNYKAYNNLIRKNVKNFGAYIAQEDQTQGDDKLENSIVIKVPVENFDDLINSIGGDSIKVIEKRITSQDVSSEVVDTKARIDAKKIVRLQYLELMRQAKNMKDILEVQAEMNTIQEEIESATGRVNYLVHQAAYSTVNLRYYQQVNGKKIEPEDSNGFMFKLKEAFKTGSSVIGNILLLLLSIWPLIIIGFLSLYLWRKKKQNKTNQS